MVGEGYVNTKVATQELGVSYDSLYGLVKRGKLPAKRVFGRYLIRMSDLLACKERRRLDAEMVGKAPEGYLTIAQAAKRCGMSTAWVHWKINEGKLAAEPKGKRGGKVVPEDALRAFLASRRVSARGRQAKTRRELPGVLKSQAERMAKPESGQRHGKASWNAGRACRRSGTCRMDKNLTVLDESHRICLKRALPTWRGSR